MLAHTLDGKLNVVGQGDLDVRAQVVAQHASCYVDNLGAYLKVVERKVAHELNIAWLDVVKGVVNKVEVNVFAHGALRQPLPRATTWWPAGSMHSTALLLMRLSTITGLPRHEKTEQT